MNYLDCVLFREIIVNADCILCLVDLIKNKITFDGVEEFVTVARDDTCLVEYKTMLERNPKGFVL